ncbi:MAG: hypothetical protein M0Z31_10575 [Clostridia bacterium]|nr:hypothetical protein [Clostridia bacterium]
MAERMDKTDWVHRSKAVPGRVRGDSVEYLKDKWKPALYSVIIAVILITMAVVVNEPLIAGGLGFGLVLGLLNYFAMAVIIDRGIQANHQGFSIAAVLMMVMYHVRFWALAFVIYLVFTYWGQRFGLSMIFGMSLLKWTALVEILESCFDPMKKDG